MSKPITILPFYLSFVKTKKLLRAIRILGSFFNSPFSIPNYPQKGQKKLFPTALIYAA